MAQGEYSDLAWQHATHMPKASQHQQAKGNPLRGATPVGDSPVQQKILDLLGAKGPTTRGDMITQLKIARTTIFDAIHNNKNGLLPRGRVMKAPVQDGKRGHPIVLFQLAHQRFLEA
jgi:hypothetical protein